MIVLIGTHTLAQTTLQLPNPGWNDSKHNNVKVQWDQMMDGTIFSYVSGTQERVFSLDFLITKEKATELTRFFKVYSTTLNRMYFYDDTAWIVRFTQPDLTFTTQTPSELRQVTLDFLARRL